MPNLVRAPSAPSAPSVPSITGPAGPESSIRTSQSFDCSRARTRLQSSSMQITLDYSNAFSHQLALVGIILTHFQSTSRCVNFRWCPVHVREPKTQAISILKHHSTAWKHQCNQTVTTLSEKVPVFAFEGTLLGTGAIPTRVWQLCPCCR